MIKRINFLALVLFIVTAILSGAAGYFLGLKGKINLSRATADILSVTAPADTAYKKFEYQNLVNVDACTLSKMSSAGWQIFQIGQVQTVQGFKEDCRNSGYVNGLDWAILYREIQQNQ